MHFCLAFALSKYTVIVNVKVESKVGIGTTIAKPTFAYAAGNVNCSSQEHYYKDARERA